MDRKVRVTQSCSKVIDLSDPSDPSDQEETKRPRRMRTGGGEFIRGSGYFFLEAFALALAFALPLAALRGVSMAAWAAAKRAIGTRNGLQLT